MSWEAISVIVNSILAIATFGIIYLNRQQVKASKQQADASEDQVRIMQKQVEAGLEQLRISRDQLRQSHEQVQGTLEAAQRPFVFPISAPALKFDGVQMYFDFDQLDPKLNDPARDEITLKNGGTGTALNILGILMQPRPEDYESLKIAPRTRMLGLFTPLPPGAEGKNVHLGVNVGYQWNSIVATDPSNTLAAPPRTDASSPLLRLTLIYYDIFGQPYASQFDLQSSTSWRFHWFGKLRPGSELLERLNR